MCCVVVDSAFLPSKKEFINREFLMCDEMDGLMQGFERDAY